MGNRLWPVSATVPIGVVFNHRQTGRLVSVSAASCVEDDIELVDMDSGRREHTNLSRFQSEYKRHQDKV